ncbi:MAG TPA: phosphoenolpyruvate--protein phosphotransferase [Pirellulales bacterium]|jgi:phosphotransferase system enzyme I (PtsI)|nr:phosphoenolpyruvate--protein phosphotransferase [Pirellulales bacterium]
MLRLQGIAVSPGVAIGEAFVMDNEGFRIPRRFLTRDAVDAELERLGRAINTAAGQIERNRDAITLELGKEYGAIFDAHLQMLRDARLRHELEQLIRERHYSPEYAVSRALRRYAKVFQALENTNLAERANDIFDIEKRLLRTLLGRRREEISQLTSPVLILAHNLTPSETANLDRQFVKGFVTEVGGPGSHTAIVAEGLAIPAVVGTGPFLADVSGGEVVIIDGNQGLVIVHPDADTLGRYREAAEAGRSRAASLKSLRDLPAETADGERIQLLGNIEFPYEAPQCLEFGSDGIGLYRTEFLYLGSDSIPSEEDHFEAYSAVVQKMAPRPVTIRTLDIGADKVAIGLTPDDERNPFLGLRSIRLSLRNVPMFRVQLRAILRASALGDVRIMFPLITTVHEFRQAKMIVGDVMEDLEEHGIAFNRDVPIGMMVEVPAAVIMIDHFVQEVDFLSIGTNDLIQYTLAVDRSNKDVASLYSASDPAVLKLIEMATRAAIRADVPIGLCGQMSGNPIYTMLLLGLGLRNLSVPPSAIPEIKKVCRSVTVAHAQSVAAKVMTLEHARDVKRYLKEELKKLLPDEGG